MSLLMDALKKAEQAKARGADASVPARPEASATPPAAPSVSEKAEAQKSAATALSLESIAPEAPPVPAPAPEEVLHFSIDQVEPLAQEKPKAEPAPTIAPPEKTSAPPPEAVVQQEAPADKMAGRAVDKLARARQSERPPAQPVEPAPVIAAVAEAPAAAVVPVVEKNTLSAEPRRQVPLMIGKPKFKRSYLWSGLLLLLFVFGLGYYFVALNSVAYQGNVAAYAPVEEAELPAATDENAEIAAVSETAVPEVKPAEPVAAKPENKPAPAKLAVLAPVKKEPAAASPAPKQTASAPKHEAAPAAAPVRTQPVQIEKMVAIDPLQNLLQAAYGAYRDGDLEAAAAKYREALKREADNRDALLGLAVIAQHQGQADTARAFYNRLLLLNPKDSVAAAGMLSLNDAGASTQNISRLKLLLQEEPAAAHLHFSLANEYAAQSAWPEAQQAYYQAYQYAPQRADYAFNLAVSLDKLGQSKAALGYYQRALEAADAGAVSFDRQMLVQRIQTLTAP